MTVARDDQRWAWIGQAESDLHEAAAIDLHEQLRAHPALVEALHRGWLTPGEVHAALADGRRLGAVAAPLSGDGPEAGGVETDRLAGQGSTTAAGPECGEAGDHTPADPRPVSLSPIGRILRLRWSGRG